ncbi:MAG: PhaM family polyhydroxyalkanoate granule multifunctional regulatory protein [Telluria sp.]
MLKPPSQNVPGMTDTLEFVKNLWGGMGVPGAGIPGLGAPQMSTDDLDKRITDLKTVETWLNLNLTMLRTSIQALEVQRGTLAALKSMTDSMAQAMGKAGDQTASLPPFASFFTAGGTPQPGTGAAASASASTQAASPGAAQLGADGVLDASMAPAVAWWNLLQDQFRQAVASAMPADGAGNPGAPASASSGGQGAAAAAPTRSEARAAPGNESRAAPSNGVGNAPRAPAGGDAGGTPGTSSPKPARPKSDKA